MHFHRDMLAICDAYCAQRAAARRRRPLHRLAAARLHLRPRRARAVPDARRRLDRAARAGDARTSCCRRSRGTARPSASPRRPPIARCWRRLGEHDVSSLRKCVSAGEALPKATFEAWQAATGLKHHGRHRRDRDAAHLHRGAARTRSGRARPASRCRATRRRSSTTDGRDAAARHGRPARGARPDRLPLPRRRAPAELRRRTAGTSPATPIVMDEDGYFWYQARSDDMIISAGYNIAGPEVEAALLDPSGGRRMRRRRRARPRARHDRQGLCRAAPGRAARRRDGEGAAGPRQGRRSRPTNIRARSSSSPSCRRPQTGKLQRFALRQHGAGRVEGDGRGMKPAGPDRRPRTCRPAPGASPCRCASRIATRPASSTSRAIST